MTNGHPQPEPTAPLRTDKVRVVPFATAICSSGQTRAVAVAKMMSDEVGGPHFYRPAITILRQVLAGEIDKRSALAQAKSIGPLIYDATRALLVSGYFDGGHLMPVRHGYWITAGFKISAWEDLAIQQGGFLICTRFHFSKDRVPAAPFGEVAAEIMRIANPRLPGASCIYAVHDVFNGTLYRAISEPADAEARLTASAWELRSTWNQIQRTG